MDPWLLVHLLGGFLLLLSGGEFLVRGASGFARTLGISPLVVGLTVVAFGTSAPELAVSVQAALAGETDVTLGNVIGSNVLNILVVLGFSALVAPLGVSLGLMRVDVPLLVAASALTWGLAADGTLSRGDGVLLLVGLVFYIGLLFWRVRRGRIPPNAEIPDDEGGPPSRSAWRQLGLVVIGLVLLVTGAHWLVRGAVELALIMGVSTLVVSLTVVALGTSLPELVISMLASLKGDRDLAAGNAVGSNLFNLLLILGVAALVTRDGIPASPPVLAFDLPVMVATAVLCLPVFFTGARISRLEGLLFLGYYAAFTLYLLLRASDHEHLHSFSRIMTHYILPLTVAGLAVTSGRALWERYRKKERTAERP